MYIKDDGIRCGQTDGKGVPGWDPLLLSSFPFQSSNHWYSTFQSKFVQLIIKYDEDDDESENHETGMRVHEPPDDSELFLK